MQHRHTDSENYCKDALHLHDDRESFPCNLPFNFPLVINGLKFFFPSN